LGSKLLLLSWGKSGLLLSGSKLLWVLSKLLVLGELAGKLAWLLSKLLLGLLSKLLLLGSKLLLLGSKLLLLSWCKLLGLLLSLLLELSKVLVEVSGVELLGSWAAGVEVGSVEDRAPWVSSALVSKGLSLGSIVSLSSNLLLPSNN